MVNLLELVDESYNGGCNIKAEGCFFLSVIQQFPITETDRCPVTLKHLAWNLRSTKFIQGG
jgi:hypothetical protein